MHTNESRWWMNYLPKLFNADLTGRSIFTWTACRWDEREEISLHQLYSSSVFHLFSSKSRLFASKCAKCQEAFSENEFFIRTAASSRRYHPDCFRCDHCDRLLVSGDEYYLHGQNQIFCREDFQQLNLTNQPNGTSTTGRAQRKKCISRAYILTSVADVAMAWRKELTACVQHRMSDQSRVLPSSRCI